MIFSIWNKSQNLLKFLWIKIVLFLPASAKIRELERTQNASIQNSVSSNYDLMFREMKTVSFEFVFTYN